MDRFPRVHGSLLLFPLLLCGLCTQFGAAPALVWGSNWLAVGATAWAVSRGLLAAGLLPLLTLAGALLELLLVIAPGLPGHALSPVLLAGFRALVLGGWLGLFWHERRDPAFPLQPVRRVLYPGLALMGLWAGAFVLLWPLLNLPLRHWLKRETRQWRLFLQSMVLLALLLLWLLPLPPVPAAEGASLPAVSDQLPWWLLPAFLQSVLVYTGRFIRNARIRSKLLATFALSSLVPIFVLGVLVTTSGFVLMGGYRANLVKVQVQERARVASMVTRWLIESFAQLQQGSLGDFESRIRTISADEDMSRVFFGLYLKEADTDSSTLWRPIQSSWRMPEGLFARSVEVPDSVGETSEGGFFEAEGRLYAVSMIRTPQVMVLGYLPVDEDLLADVGTMLSVEVQIRQLRREDVVGYSASHINLVSQPVPSRELTRTPGFNQSGNPLLNRLYSMGMARLEPGELPLGDPEDVYIIHVETTPGQILGSVFSGHNQDNLIYLAMLVLQVLVLVPLFMMAFWVAFLTGRRITRSVDELREGTLRLGAGEFDIPIPVATSDELGDLAASFNRMSERIRASITSLAEKERLDQELAIARKIQRVLLPAESPDWDRLDIAALNVPAREVGGDYYDWRITAGGSLAFVLGDVSGKGVSAALLMANVQAAWSVLVSEGLAPERVARRLNRHLCRVSGEDMFVTLFHGEMAREPGMRGVRIRWCNCGHNPPLLIRRGQLVELAEGGLLLGMFPDAPFETSELMLEPGDRLLLYTDGLTETQDASGEEFGEHRLRKLLEGGLPAGSRPVIEFLVARLQDFNGGQGYGDDLTLMVIGCPDAPVEPEPGESV